MVDMDTSYLGMQLNSPIITGANNLTVNIDKALEAEEMGAGAFVYKSLFEEQIELEKLGLEEAGEEYSNRHAEMITVMPNMEHAGPEQHLLNIGKIKESLKIPVIASLNAVNKETWVEYAKKIEDTGVDAIEANLYYVPKSIKKTPVEVEDEQMRIVDSIRNNVKIPLSLKLSYFYSNPLNTIKKMDDLGVDGFVLFNRLFQPNIDIDKVEHIKSFNLSNIEDNRMPLRFTGLLYGEINADICSSMGIFTGADVAKMILAGADCIQTVSSIYKYGTEQIKEMLKNLEAWMEAKGYENIKEFRGLLSNKRIKDPFVYSRAQYVDILMGDYPPVKKDFKR